MKYSIDLEAPFAYSAFWYAIGLGLILLAILLRFLFNMLFSQKVESPLKKDKLYKKTMQELDDIDKSYRNKQLDLRTLHQKLSKTVRQYVETMEGLRAQSMVYDELCLEARPELADLIGDYYGPEFAYVPQADAESSISKAKALVNGLYQRDHKEKKLNASARRRSAVNNFLNRIMRIAPGFMTPAVLSLIRANSSAWADNVEKTALKGDLDSYSVRGQMSKEVRSFVYAATGAKTSAEAFRILRRKAKSGDPAIASAATAALDLYDPGIMYRSSYNPQFAITKGKELIKKWV